MKKTGEAAAGEAKKRRHYIRAGWKDVLQSKTVGHGRMWPIPF